MRWNYLTPSDVNFDVVMLRRELLAPKDPRSRLPPQTQQGIHVFLKIAGGSRLTSHYPGEGGNQRPGLPSCLYVLTGSPESEIWHQFQTSACGIVAYVKYIQKETVSHSGAIGLAT